MSSEAVTEILEEVVPESVRGKQIARSITMSGCNVIQLIDYGNVSIMRSTHTCDPFSLEQDIRTAITFKRDACPKLSNWHYPTMRLQDLEPPQVSPACKGRASR
jgi:hypothetical protein